MINDCKHNAIEIRRRMRETIKNSSAYSFISLKFDEPSLETIIDTLVSWTTVECKIIMHEHAEECFEEVTRILETIGK